VDRITVEGLAENETTRVRFVAWIVLNDLIVQHGEVDLVKLEMIGPSFLIGMIGDPNLILRMASMMSVISIL